MIKNSKDLRDFLDYESTKYNIKRGGGGVNYIFGN